MAALGGGFVVRPAAGESHVCILPSDAYYFSCRHCYDLSYESVQSSRTKSQYFFNGVAQHLESTTRQARLWFRVVYGGGS